MKSQVMMDRELNKLHQQIQMERAERVRAVAEMQEQHVGVRITTPTEAWGGNHNHRRGCL